MQSDLPVTGAKQSSLPRTDVFISMSLHAGQQTGHVSLSSADLLLRIAIGSLTVICCAIMNSHRLGQATVWRAHTRELPAA